MNPAADDHFEHELPVGLASCDTAAIAAALSAAIPAGGGVYCLYDAERRPALLAAAQNLRRAIVGRLTGTVQDGEPSRRARLAEVVAVVRWTQTHSLFESELRHLLAARTLYPRDYRKRIGIAPAWFIAARLPDATPRLATVTAIPAGAFADAGDPSRERAVGPFATQRDAERIARMLEDLFDLCRYHHILAQAPHGAPCAYFDMGRCAAPCAGRALMDDYRRDLAAALDFAAGDREPRQQAVRAAMKRAADAQQFELAAGLRETLQRGAAAVAHPSAARMVDARRFRWLILQRGGPATRAAARMLARPFLLRGSTLAVGAPLPLARVSTDWSMWRAWLAAAPGSPPPAGFVSHEGDELVWLACRYLFKGGPQPGLFVRADQAGVAPVADELAAILYGPTGRRLRAAPDQANAERGAAASAESPPAV